MFDLKQVFILSVVVMTLALLEMNGKEINEPAAEFVIRASAVVIDSNEFVIPARMCNLISHEKRILLHIESEITENMPDEFCRRWIVVRCPWYKFIAQDSSMCFRISAKTKSAPDPLSDTIRVRFVREAGDTVSKSIPRFEFEREVRCLNYFLRESNYTQFDLLQVLDCSQAAE